MPIKPTYGFMEMLNKLTNSNLSGYCRNNLPPPIRRRGGVCTSYGIELQSLQKYGLKAAEIEKRKPPELGGFLESLQRIISAC